MAKSSSSSSEQNFEELMKESAEETSVGMQLSKLRIEVTTASNTVSESDENTINENHIFKFETEVLKINIQKFATNDKEKILKIIEWFKKQEEKKKLTVAEIKSFDKIKVYNEKQKYFRVLFEEKKPEWAAVDECIIEKVPFLEAVCSERWNQNGDVYIPFTITNVRASSLKLLNFVIQNGEYLDNYLEKVFSDRAYAVLGLFKESINDFNFLWILGTRDQELLSSVGFNLVETCKLVRGKYTEAALKLLLATQLGWFNDNFVSNTKKLYSFFNFTKKQLDRLGKLEGGVSRRDRYDDDEDDNYQYCCYSDSDGDYYYDD